MMSSFTRQAAHGATAIRRAFSWASRVGAARRAMTQLARMSDTELRDIGLVRQDIVDASMLRFEADPSEMLASRRAARELPASEARDLAA
jgi:uncharacterized protein YjiS (DUF1127 family)